MSTTPSSIPPTNASTAIPPPPLPNLAQMDVSTPTAVCLVLSGSLLACFYAVVMVAIYRVSRQMSPFILFLSHGCADLGLLLLMPLMPYVEQLGGFHIFADPQLEFFLFQSCLIAAYLHIVLIAINRGHSMLAPLSYSRVWTRRACYQSAFIVWMVNIAVVACVVGVHLGGQPQTALAIWMVVAPVVQLSAVGIAFLIYLSVLVTVLGRRLLGRGWLTGICGWAGKPIIII